MAAAHALLPPQVRVLERGWLSSNSILLLGDPSAGPILIDTGYASHAQQTLALVAEAIAGEARGLSRIINTHLHSDHCGGNAALMAVYGCPAWIPPGHYQAALDWNEAQLSYRPTGQQCPRFTPTAMLEPGALIEHAGLRWQVHAAPGHDPHSLLLFEQHSRTLVSADALWEHGFGIVFPEIEGEGAFDEVDATLALIEELSPRVVIPGHGAVFDNVSAALSEARSKLAFFRREPARHAKHASKALIMFHMLEVRAQSRPDLLAWLQETPIQRLMWERYFSEQQMQAWCDRVIAELLAGGVLAMDEQERLSIA